MKEIVFLVLVLGFLSIPVFVRFVDPVARTRTIHVGSDVSVDRARMSTLDQGKTDVVN